MLVGQSPTCKCSSYVMWEIVIGMTLVVLRSNYLDVELGLGIPIESPLKSSPNDMM